MIQDCQKELTLEKIQILNEQLIQQQNLRIIKAFTGDDNFFLVQNNKEEDYLMQLIEISYGEDGKIFQDLLEQAKQYTKILQECEYPNINKYCNEFQIGNYYAVLTKSCITTLQDWLNQNKPIKEDIYIKFAIQILEAAEYLHQKKQSLRDLSLSNIFLDENLNIKICNFVQFIYLDCQMLDQLQLSTGLSGMFCLPPKFLQSAKEKDKIYLNQVTDMWIVGICLYLLAGAEEKQTLQFIKGINNFQIQYSFSLEINSILLQMLQNDVMAIPSLQQIIQSFKNILNDQNKDSPQVIENQQLSKNEYLEEENYVELLEKALLQYNINLSEQQIPLFEEIIKINPKCEAAYYKLGNIYIKLKQEDKALENFNQAININHRFSYAYLKLGFIYQKMQIYDKAKDSYKQSNQINPLDLSYYRLGGYLEKMEFIEEAIEYYKISIKNNEFVKNSFQRLDILLDVQTKYNEFIIFLKSVINQDDKSILPYKKLGEILLEKNDVKQSIAAYKQGIQFGEQIKVIHPLILLKRYTNRQIIDENMISKFNLQTKYSFDFFKISLKLAHLYLLQKMSNLCEEMLKQTLLNYQKDFYKVQIYNNLGCVYYQKRQYYKAVTISKIANKQNEQKGIHVLMKSYYDQGKFDKIIKFKYKRLKLKADLQQKVNYIINHNKKYI